MAKQNEGDRIKTIADETQVVVEDALRSISANIGDIFAQALTQGQDAAKTLAKDVTGSINSLAKSTSALVSNQEKANKGLLSYKDVTKEIQTRNAKIAALKNQITIAERSGVGNAKELKKQLSEIERYNSEVADSMQQQLNYSKDISKTMGLTGAAIGGIGKLAGKLGFDKMADTLEEARDRASAMAKKIVDAKGEAGGLRAKFKILGSTIGFLGKTLLKNLFDPLVLIKGAVGLIKGAFGLVKKAVTGFINMGKEAKDAYKQLGMAVSAEVQGIARGMGVAQDAASKLYKQVAGLGPTAGASASSITSIYNAMGSTEELSGKTLDRFVKLNTYAGYSAESLANMQSYAKVLGKDAGDVVDEFNKQIAAQIKSSNLAIGQKQAFEAVSKVSSSIRASLGGSEAAIVKAVLSSKKLGMELEDALDSAKGFLNLEENIAAEQELRLLTGQDIDLTKARELAATRDFAGLNKEIARITKQIGGDALNNQFVMDAISKTLGISADKVTDILNADKERVKTSRDLNTEAENANIHAQGRATMGEAEERRERSILSLKAMQGRAFKEFAEYMQKSIEEIKSPIRELFGLEFTAWWDDPGTRDALDSIKASIKNILTPAEGGLMKKTFDYIFNPQTGIVNRSLRDLSVILGGNKLTNPESFLGKAINFFTELKDSETFQALRDGMEAGHKAVVGIFKAFDKLMKIPGMKTLLTTFVAGAATVKTFKFAMNATGLSSIFGKKDGSNPASALYVQMAGGMPGMSAVDFAGDMMTGGAYAPGVGGYDKKGRYRDSKGRYAKDPNKGRSRRTSRSTRRRGRPGRGGRAQMFMMAGAMLAPMALSAFDGGGEDEGYDEGYDADFTKEMQEQALADAQNEIAERKKSIDTYVNTYSKTISSKQGEITIEVYGKTFTGKNLAEAKGKATAFITQKELGTKQDEVKAMQEEMKSPTQKFIDNVSMSYDEFMYGEKPGENAGSNALQAAGTGGLMGLVESGGSLLQSGFDKAKTFASNVAKSETGQKVIQGMKNLPKSSGSTRVKAPKKSWGAQMWDDAVSWGKSTVDDVVGGAQKMGRGAMSLADDAYQGVKSGVSTAYNWGKSGVNAAVDWGKSAVDDAGKALARGSWATLEFLTSPQTVKKVKDLMKGNLVRNLIGSAAGFGKSALRWLFKTGPLSAAIDSIFSIAEINEAVAMGVSGADLQKLVGQKAVGVLGGVVGGVGMEALTGLVMQGIGTLLPGIGNAAMGALQAIISPTLYMVGDSLGRDLFQYSADALGGDIPIGKLIMEMGWPKDPGTSMGKADDMYSGYGKRILLHPEGAIALNNKDTVVAGTNLFRGDDVYSGPAGSMVSSAAVLAKLDQLINVIERGGNVFLDGQKVGTALVQGNYRTQ